jgi:glycosyltransferase involved in cell wall biosynthesis
MEALLHRVPVIASDVSGIGELIEDGVTGLLIQEKRPLAISQAVQRMIHDRPEALEMAERGRSRVMEQFNPDINHKRVFELYEAMFAKGQA